MKLIDAEGPITFQLLSDWIARAHGFQRTGREIAAKVWAAVRGRRRHTRTYPEKLGLVRDIIGKGSSDLARDVAESIGVARVTTRFKSQVEDLRRRLGDQQ